MEARLHTVAWGIVGLGWLAWIVYAFHGPAGDSADAVGIALAGTILAAAVLPNFVAGAAERSGARVALGVAITGYGFSFLTYKLVAGTGQHFPSMGDAGAFAFYPIAFVTVVVVVWRRLAIAGAAWLDVAIGAVGTACAGATIVYPQLGAMHGAPIIGKFLYFLGDLGFLGLLLGISVLGGRRAAHALGWAVACAAALAVGDAAFALATSRGTGPGTLSLLMWPAGVLLLATPFTVPEGALAPVSNLTSVGLPALSALICLPAAAFSPDGSPQHVLGVSGLVLVIVRMGWSVIENRTLLSHARASAIRDPLTGLANRTLLLDRLGQALLRQSRHGGDVGVLFVDLDDFKHINDVHGHEVGDRVLVATARRLAAALRLKDSAARGVTGDPVRCMADTVARLGGDEFVILIDELVGADAMGIVCERALNAIGAPLQLDGRRFFLRASIGVVVTDGRDGQSPSDLLRDADTAMYEAKRSGKGGYEFFRTDMHRAAVERSELARDLRDAIGSEQLCLRYQPIVDLRSGRTIGVEALVRWNHPERGLLTPDRFIPLAETNGLIVPLDDWVLDRACRQMVEWDAAGLDSLHIAVNVSARRLTSGNLAETIRRTLARTGASARRLELEVTETAAVAHGTEVTHALQSVRDLGVKVAIDDFGMGHSALSRLHTFPVDRLKIDRSFIARLQSGTERDSLAAAMIAMADSLRLDVIAEGVETEEHRHALAALGCELAQGYLFSRPVEPAEIPGCLRPVDALPPSASTATAAPATVTTGRNPQSPQYSQLVRNLLAELQRLTGLESTYLTYVDWDEGRQHITHARNTGQLEISPGDSVEWADTVCRRSLSQGIPYTDDVPAVFPDSRAASALGLQTYVGVPITGDDGTIHGTLCGASPRRVPLGKDTLRVMERFAKMLARVAK